MVRTACHGEAVIGAGSRPHVPTQLVDTVDLICCQNPDPTDAVKAVARRYMRTDLAPRDRPIYEEFQRTARRWNEAH